MSEKATVPVSLPKPVEPIALTSTTSNRSTASQAVLSEPSISLANRDTETTESTRSTQLSKPKLANFTAPDLLDIDLSFVPIQSTTKSIAQPAVVTETVQTASVVPPLPTVAMDQSTPKRLAHPMSTRAKQFIVGGR